MASIDNCLFHLLQASGILWCFGGELKKNKKNPEYCGSGVKETFVCADKCREFTHTRTHLLTPLSLPDLRVMEVRCLILMNKRHSGALLVKTREIKYVLLLFGSHETGCRKERKTVCQHDLLSIKSIRSDSWAKALKFHCFSYVAWNELQTPDCFRLKPDF